MVQLSGKICCNVQGTCVYSSLLESAIQIQHMDRIYPKLPNPSDVKSMNVMMTLEKKTCSLGLDMFSSLFPHLFVSNPASKSPAEGSLFASFLGGQFREKSPRKVDTESFFCCFHQTKKTPHQKTRVTGNEHVANVPLIFANDFLLMISHPTLSKDSKFQHRQLEASLLFSS